MRLLTFYTAANDAWDTRTGIVWSKKHAGGLTADIIQATKYSIGKFWTPYQGVLDDQGVDHQCDIVEHFGADGAGNMQTAGRFMLGKGVDGIYEIFSNALQVDIDVTHGTTRLLKRPWNANDHIKTVLHTLTWDKGSVVNIIQNSKEISLVFT